MVSNKFLRNAMFTAVLAGMLILTYDKCVWCVLAIAVISGLTMSCIPASPIIFVLSLSVLLYHAVDYRNATVKVEVPLENFVYIPTWDDVGKYVHVSPSMDSDQKKI